MLTVFTDWGIWLISYIWNPGISFWEIVSSPLTLWWKGSIVLGACLNTWDACFWENSVIQMRWYERQRLNYSSGEADCSWWFQILPGLIWITWLCIELLQTTITTSSFPCTLDLEWFLNLPMEICPPHVPQKQLNEWCIFFQDSYDS